MFVQYENVNVANMPRTYVALGSEVSAHLQTGSWGRLSLVLIESRTLVRGPRKGKSQKIPESWVVSEERIRKVHEAAGI